MNKRALLTIEAGHGEPRVCILRPDERITLGRHRGNVVVLQDEHASRWHAELIHKHGRWLIRDFGALNCTRLNGQPVTQPTVLEDGQIISIGKTRLRYSVETGSNGNTPPPESKSLSPVEQAGTLDDGQTILCMDELTALCQFMANSVKTSEPHSLIQRALEVVHRQTGATVTGFLSLDESEPLPKIVFPALSQVDTQLSRRLTQEVQRQGLPVWLGSHPDFAAGSESLLSFSDAVCVPLQVGETPLGALHAYKKGDHFNEREVRFCEVLAGHLAGSLHVLRVQRTLEAENSRLRSHSPVADQLIGSSAALQALRHRIARLAPHCSTVLIVGESGAGKELVALALHRQSNRHEGPLVTVNCAAIAPTLLESELFGHTKGAFSGADKAHRGFFQQADEGTLFLDEVGELSLECQAKLLRVIERKGFRPIGATQEVQVDVRIIAATHRNLEREVEAGRFRQDLYFRLQGLQLRVPPLREHLEDLPELVEYFLESLAGEYGRLARLSDAALDKLHQHSWPGNVRQLRSVLENAVALSEKELLEPADLLFSPASGGGEPHSLNLEELEAWAIRQALRRTDGNITQAARLLGVVRDTLTNRMKKLGIERT